MFAIRSPFAGALLSCSLAGSLLAAGCGGGGGGGSDPEVGANPLYVVDMDLDGLDGVSLNRPFLLEFSEFVDPETVRPDTVQVRLGPRFGVQAFGEFKVSGNLVTFYPQLPSDSELKDAGFQPQSTYRVTVVGNPKVNRVRAYTGRPLVKTFTGSFATAALTSPDLFTTDTYKDAPPPRVQFTNPPDVLPVSPWTQVGGAKEVPTDAEISAVFNRVPLRPETITTNNVSLTMIERLGTPQNRPIQGTPVVEQSFDGVTLHFRPTFPLADQARYVLRIENRVTDLTGQFDVADNAARTALRTLAETGADPALTAFALAHPEEVDPRTFLVFTTRDEPTKDLAVTLNFDGTDLDQDGGEGVDKNNTTASFNLAVPGAVAAQFTAAGGNGTLGDFSPSGNTTLNTNSPSAVNGAFNYQRINVPANVTVTVTGTVPATLLALRDVTVDGSITLNGSKGGDSFNSYTASSTSWAQGGAAGPGSGKGGNAYNGTNITVSGGNGEDGPNGGGTGGRGGGRGTGTYYNLGGGGAGGGHKFAGTKGADGAYPSQTSWNGKGGAGGASSGIDPTSANTSDGKEFHSKGVGGGGGGASGNYHNSPNNWHGSGAAGGGAGGALLIKGAGNIQVRGRIEAVGGAGGNGVYTMFSAGGGGAGGTVALYANIDLDVNGGYLDTSGGSGGTVAYTYNATGGKGGGGFVHLEDQNGVISGISGATTLPDYSTGTFDPTGTASDAPSVYTSTWFNLGVFDPTLLPFVPQDFTETVPSGMTAKYEIQMAIEDPTNFGKADTSSINIATGASSDYARASDWLVFKDPVLGVLDATPTLNGKGYQFYRLRFTFTLKDGQKRSDPVPFVDSLRIRAKY